MIARYWPLFTRGVRSAQFLGVFLCFAAVMLPLDMYHDRWVEAFEWATWIAVVVAVAILNGVVEVQRDLIKKQDETLVRQTEQLKRLL